jgi:mono/diheme cytochrome c family protein
MQRRPSLASALAVAAALLGAAAVPLTIRAQAADTAAPDATALYKKHCVMCHAANGDSKMPGMSFTDGVWKHGSSVKEVSAIIHDGVKGTAMLPFKNKLSDAEIETLAKYVRAFDKNLKG